MDERKAGCQPYSEPLEISRVLDEIALDFGACTPLEAAAGALMSIEAIPRYRAASMMGKNKPPEDPLHRQYEAAKSYLTTLDSLQQKIENGTLLASLTESNPDEDQNDPATTGKLRAYEDLQKILSLLQAPGFSISQN